MTKDMEITGIKAASINRQTDLMTKNEILKARIKELEAAIAQEAKPNTYQAGYDAANHMAQKHVRQLREEFDTVLSAYKKLYAHQQKREPSWTQECADFWENYSMSTQGAQDDLHADAANWVHRMRVLAREPMSEDMQERCAKTCEDQQRLNECPERAQYCADAIRALETT